MRKLIEILYHLYSSLRFNLLSYNFVQRMVGYSFPYSSLFVIQRITFFVRKSLKLFLIKEVFPDIEKRRLESFIIFFLSLGLTLLSNYHFLHRDCSIFLVDFVIYSFILFGR